jgi:hypothetical protein
MSTAWVVAFCVLCAFVLGLAVVVQGVFRQVVPLIERSQGVLEFAVQTMRTAGLPEGAQVPSFFAEDPSGAMVTHADLQRDWHVVLFLNSDCGTCSDLVRDARAHVVPPLPARVLVIVNDGDVDAQELLAVGETGPVRVVLQRSFGVSRAFASDRTPHAFVVDPAGTVRGSGMPTSWAEIGGMVESAMGGGDRLNQLEGIAAAT